jgi:hypothetical protein
MTTDDMTAWVEQAASETSLAEQQAEAWYRREIRGQSRRDVADAMGYERRDSVDDAARRVDQKIAEAEKLRRLLEAVDYELDETQAPPDGGSSIRAFLAELADAIAIEPEPDVPPEEAGLETVAEYCGIHNPETVEPVVPVEEYRDQGGMLTCQLSNREPYPPETILAKYPVPNGGRELLSNQAYQDLLTESYPLSDAEAKALAFTRAGWPAWELQEVVYDGPRDKAELVASARETLPE